MGEWTRVTVSNPCPVCGRDKLCARHADGFVKCARRHKGDQAETPGWEFARELAAGKLGVQVSKWVPDGYVERDRDPEVELQRRNDDEAKRKRRIGQARKAWQTAGSDAIDGGQGHERIRRYVESRGISVSDLPGAALPATMRFHPECPDTWDADRKRWNRYPAIVSKVVGPGGEFEGIHRLYLDRESDAKRSPELGVAKKKLGECKGRVLRLSQNLSAGVLILCEGWETGLALQAAVGNKAAVWCALDSPSLKCVDLPRKAIQFGSADAIHTVIIAGDLDDSTTNPPFAGQVAGTLAAGAIRNRAPWLTVVTRYPNVSHCEAEANPLGLVERRDGRDLPKGGQSVDWLDVYVAAKDRARVSSMIFAELDLEANERRAYNWRPDDHREVGSGDDQAGKVRYAPEGALQRARAYLLDEESPPKSSRAGSRFWLARWNGKWYEWDRRRWVELDEEHLRGRVWHWLDQFYDESRGKTVRLDPTRRMVEDVIAALTTDTAVTSKSIPCWISPSFDRHGDPVWGSAAPGARAEIGRPDAGEVVSYRNGILDVRALRDRGEVDWADHDPTWFSTSSLPYDLPIRELRSALRSNREAAEILRNKCPTWLRFLGSAWEDENARACLQEFVGLTLTMDNSLERFLLVPGPPGSGKGTIETVWVALLGEENVAATSFDRLTERFHMATLVGRNLAIMPDASIGRFTDTTKAVENMKAVTGNDLVPIEEKYRRDVVSMRLPVRFAVFCNELPKILDAGGALSERMVLLPMERSFRTTGDPTLKSRVVREVEGIAIWAILGLVRLARNVEARRKAIETGDEEAARRDVFTIAERAPAMVEDFRRDSSRAYAFVSDCCEVGPDFEEDWATIASAFNGWAEDNGYRASASSTISRQINGTVPGLITKQHGKGSRGRYVVGLKLTADGRGYLEQGEGQGIAFDSAGDGRDRDDQASTSTTSHPSDDEESPW